jgi:Planctomycete cytochrome C
VKRVAAAALVLAGCLSPIAPDVGPLVHASCSNDDSDPATPVHFDADIHDAIFAGDEYHCTRCHTGRGDTPIGLEVGGLDLRNYDTLRAGGRHGPDIVVPGRPCDSILVQKLGEAAPFGARMPLDGPPFLDDDDLQLVSDWIAEGAHDD